jgi:TolB-like protein
MLDLRLWSVALVLCGLFLSSASAADFKKTKIAVLDFEQRGDAFKTQDMGGIVAEWFTTAMVKDGRFQVVERALLKQIIEEQKLGMSGLIDTGSTAQLGKILGVKTIISGSVLLFQDYVEVNARIINVNTGSIVAAENLRSANPEKLKEAIENLTAKIVKNFPLTGYIVKKRESTVLIDLGASGGLHPGMEFIVFKEGEAIKHPKTGEVLDVEQIRTGKIKIVEIGANTATAEILEVEPNQEIRYGQLVQSIRKLDAPTEEKGETPDTAIKDGPPQTKPRGTGVVAVMPPATTPIETTQQPPSPPTSTKSPETSTEGYQRSEFLPGERDNLASGGQGPALLPLPTGTFMMGSERFSEKPVHFVKIERPVWMMVAEVTFEEYEKFSLETGAAFPDDTNWGKKDRPVINVSWSDARAYARWLSKQTGFTYRLPTSPNGNGPPEPVAAPSTLGETVSNPTSPIAAPVCPADNRTTPCRRGVSPPTSSAFTIWPATSGSGLRTAGLTIIATPRKTNRRGKFRENAVITQFVAEAGIPRRGKWASPRDLVCSATPEAIISAFAW